MNSSVITTLCLIGGLIVILGVFLSTAIRIVPEYRRLIVFRLGRSIGENLILVVECGRKAGSKARPFCLQLRPAVAAPGWEVTLGIR